jgi:peroxiredoxin
MRNTCLKYFIFCCFAIAYCGSINAQVIDDFYLESTESELVSLDEIKGSKLTIIDFWATWCKPCTKAMPKLNDIYTKYKDQGLSIVGISCDGPRSISKVASVANSLEIDYTILKDIDCEVMNTYQYQAFPTLLLLDENNEVVWLHEGYVSGDEKTIEQEVADRLD